MRFARLGVVLLALLGGARGADADLLSRALGGDDDQAGGGAPPPPQQPDDLTEWAGAARSTSLPELLRHAVQHAPSLASAKIDIAIAEARIYQTYARDDWKLA